MGSDGVTEMIYSASDWIVRIAYINLLWIIFSLIGLLVFGFFPATVAMFAVLRKWIRTEEDIPVFKTFWKSYRSEFLTSNSIGLIIVAIGYILYIDFKFFATFDNWIGTVVPLLLVAVTMIFIVILLYIFPVIAHFKLKTLQYLKHALIIGVSFPKNTFLLLSGMIAIFFIISLIPIHLTIFFGSIISFFIMKVSNFPFEKLKDMAVQS